MNVYTSTFDSKGDLWAAGFLTGVKNLKDISSISLGEDQIIGTDEIITLDAGSDWGTYLWNNESTGQTVLVDGSTLGVGEYTYSVTVTDGNCPPSSDEVKITVELAQGIEDDKENSAFKLFPNPVNNGLLTIEINNPEIQEYSIEIVNTNGQTILKQSPVSSSNSNIIDLSGTAKGIYLLKIQSDTFSEVNKLIIK